MESYIEQMTSEARAELNLSQPFYSDCAITTEW